MVHRNRESDALQYLVHQGDACCTCGTLALRPASMANPPGLAEVCEQLQYRRASLHAFGIKSSVAIFAPCFTDHFPQREPYTVPPAEILSKAEKVRPVLLAHPLERPVSLCEPVGRACWVWVDVFRQDARRQFPCPGACAPNVRR
jgi:hypothetical protein